MTSVSVFVHNHTSSPLRRIHSGTEGGEWGQRPPEFIDAYGVATMSSRSDGFLTGTEGRATYQIGSDPGSTLYLHWNNPYSGSNSYHTNTDQGHFSQWRASGSTHATVHFTLQNAGRVETDFTPSRDGFIFANEWPNTPYSLPPLRGSLLDNKYGNAENGLCGGMVLAALDYFELGWERPDVPDAPSGERDPLFLYFVDRLFDTFSLNSVTLMLKLMNPAYPDGDDNMISDLGLASGRAAVMAHQEWPLIKNDLDAGRPSPIAVITVKSLLPWDLGRCHQVLAYAYEVSGHDVTLSVYDPNQPMIDSVTISFNDGDVSERIVVTQNVFSDRPIYCFARMDWTLKRPPVETAQRFTRKEESSRRITVIRDDEATIARSDEVARGRRQFSIEPDCGTKEFEFVITSDVVQWGLQAVARYYRDPVIGWHVNGIAVPVGEQVTLSVPGAERAARGSSVSGLDEGWPGPPLAPVTLRATVDGPRLLLENDPSDGNYTVIVRVTASERDRPGTDTRDSTSVTFVGTPEAVPGLPEATAECFRGYVKRRMQDQSNPAAAAVALVVAAQLNRPPDPLWDPDPQVLLMAATTAEDDPTVVDVREWQSMVEPPARLDIATVDAREMWAAGHLVSPLEPTLGEVFQRLDVTQLPNG